MGDRASLDERYGLLRQRGSLIHASVIAAHGASGESGENSGNGGNKKTEGFRMTDVRFYFFLFSNWLEHDVVRATEPLELTQVRRLLQRMVSRGWARSAGAGSRAARFSLTASGVASLVDLLTSGVEERSFDEGLFIMCFAACYGPAIVGRAPAGQRSDLGERLDPKRLLRSARQRVDRVIRDLEERIRSSDEMQVEAHERLARGEGDAAVTKALERDGAYQLQHVRSFRELMLGLPRDLLAFELNQGIGARNRLLFRPMLEQAKAQREVLARLASE